MENSEKFELVLYFNRKVISKPIKPVFEDTQKDNPVLDTDNLLDLFSELMNKYNINLRMYESVQNNTIVSDYIRILEDENIFENITKFEKNDFFIEWDANSKRLIDNTLIQIFK